jgi:hypothetical protein
MQSVKKGENHPRIKILNRYLIARHNRTSL